MSYIRNHSRGLLLAVCCIALGVGISAIATAGAATSSSAQATGAHVGQRGSAGVDRRGRRAGLRRLAARAVSGNVVVHTRQGFANVSFERGRVDTVSGRQLTITEGTRRASYKTVTVTIPAGAIVRDDHQTAALASVKPGQRVLILNAPRRTFVIAHTPRAGATR